MAFFDPFGCAQDRPPFSILDCCECAGGAPIYRRRFFLRVTRH